MLRDSLVVTMVALTGHEAFLLLDKGGIVNGLIAIACIVAMRFFMDLLYK